jgi:hypothetical protein
LNVITPEWDPKDQSLEAKLTIIQEACLQEHPTLRIHSLYVGFFNSNGEVYECRKIVLNAKAKTVITYDGSKQPKAILLNYNDEDFVKVRCDETSIKFFISNLNKVEKPLTKVLIWKVLWDMVRDSKVPAPVYVKLACKHMPETKTAYLLDNMLLFSKGCVDSYTCPEF